MFFFNGPATTEIYTLSLHDALPISLGACGGAGGDADQERRQGCGRSRGAVRDIPDEVEQGIDVVVKHRRLDVQLLAHGFEPPAHLDSPHLAHGRPSSTSRSEEHTSE